MTTSRSSFFIASTISLPRVWLFGAWPQYTIARRFGVLVDQLVLLQHAVDPARHRHAGLFHHAFGELLLDPLVVDAPDRGPVLPRAGGEAVVAGQRIGVRADVGRALHVVVAAEDVGAAAGDADVAERELQDARRADHRVADRVLRLAHAPDDRRRPVLGHHLGDLEHLRLGHAADLLDLVRRPLGHHVLLDLVHAVDAVVDVLLVLPAVLEDVVAACRTGTGCRCRSGCARTRRPSPRCA